MVFNAGASGEAAQSNTKITKDTKITKGPSRPRPTG